jgi:hypothetical protein
VSRGCADRAARLVLTVGHGGSADRRTDLGRREHPAFGRGCGPGSVVAATITPARRSATVWLQGTATGAATQSKGVASRAVPSLRQHPLIRRPRPDQVAPLSADLHRSDAPAQAGAR